jgi:hypothetical protein
MGGDARAVPLRGKVSFAKPNIALPGFEVSKGDYRSTGDGNRLLGGITTVISGARLSE